MIFGVECDGSDIISLQKQLKKALILHIQDILPWKILLVLARSLKVIDDPCCFIINTETTHSKFLRVISHIQHLQTQ